MRDRIFSAVRSLVEAASHQQPLVLAIEDIHWADEGMLDLIEYLARWVRGPVLLVCLARDELLDRRPGWGGGRRNATTISLEPLGPETAPRAGRRAVPDAEAANGHADLIAPGRRALRRQPAVRRGDGQPDPRGGRAATPQALPETVHSVLAARLDSLRTAERPLLQHASVVGQTFWEGSLRPRPRARAASARRRARLAPGQGPDRPTAGSRLAGEREYAFKHVLIRDVAYSTLPKAVRARKHAEVGDFIEERAADRAEGVVAMVADHYGRAAALGADAGLDADELRDDQHQARSRRSRRPATSPPGSTRTRRRSATTRRRSACDGDLDEDGARRGSPRSWATSRCASAASTRRSRSGRSASTTTAAQEDLARVGDLHRKIGAGALAQGRPRGLDRPLPAGDRPAEGRPALHRAGAPLRGGRLALHAHRRQHARDLRLGEGAAPRRAARGGGGGEPRPRHLRPRLRADRRLRAGAREPGALGRAGARVRPGRGGPRAAHARLPPRGLRGRLRRGRRRPTARRWSSPSEIGDLPSQVELHAALGAARRATAASGTTVAAETEALARARRARGPARQALLPVPDARGAALARGRLGRRREIAAPRRRARRAGRPLRGRLPGALLARRARSATAASTPSADTGSRRRSTSASAPGWSPSRSRRPRRGRSRLALGGRADAAREAAEEAARPGRAAALPGRQRRGARGRRGRPTRTRPPAPRRWPRRGTAWAELGRPLDAARAEYIRGLVLRHADPAAANEALERAAEAAEEYGIGHLAGLARGALAD